MVVVVNTVKRIVNDALRIKTQFCGNFTENELCIHREFQDFSEMYRMENFLNHLFTAAINYTILHHT